MEFHELQQAPQPLGFPLGSSSPRASRGGRQSPHLPSSRVYLNGLHSFTESAGPPKQLLWGNFAFQLLEILPSFVLSRPRGSNSPQSPPLSIWFPSPYAHICKQHLSTTSLNYPNMSVPLPAGTTTTHVFRHSLQVCFPRAAQVTLLEAPIILKTSNLLEFLLLSRWSGSHLYFGLNVQNTTFWPSYILLCGHTKWQETTWKDLLAKFLSPKLLLRFRTPVFSLRWG